jgi:predicted lactoylglutathione lyase
MANEKNIKIQEAWQEFQNKMVELKKRQSEILASIAKKLDQQKIDKIMKKIKK